jgi:ABC-type lipoprotein export system ATPase subunit/GNAT superfamily N-acetyltransferase
MEEYKKSFTVKPDQSSTEIAEAFGISSGYQKQVVDVSLPKTLPQVTYITGESGCGKTTLINMLSDGIDNEDKNIPDGPLWSWGDDLDQSLEYLSKVGLGDATMFVSEYSELSDSQQYRAKLYLALLNSSEGETLHFDEFLSTLDRKTAKSVAFLFQKIARKENLNIVCSTAHDDLEDYLVPDCKIKGRAFPHRWNIERFRVDEVTNPFIQDLRFESKDSDWYYNCPLAELHYKGKHVGGVKDYIAVYFDRKLIGLLIGTYRIHDGGRRISRIVVHPSYRGLGIGQEIVSYYLDKEPGVDVVAEMAKYNPVFEKAGMERVENSVVSPPTGLKSDLDEHGFDRDRWYNKDYCVEFMEEKKNREMLANYNSDIGRIFISPGGKNTSKEEDREKILNEPHTAGRVLWNIRPKKMAKFVDPRNIEGSSQDEQEEESSVFDY